jgi:hypothetical protein
MTIVPLQITSTMSVISDLLQLPVRLAGALGQGCR